MQHIDNSFAFKVICFVLFKHCDALSLAFMGVCDGERPSVFHRKICSVKNLHFFAFILYIRNFMIIIFGHQSSLNQHSNQAQRCMFGLRVLDENLDVTDRIVMI
jgi:hypothetical protein